MIYCATREVWRNDNLASKVNFEGKFSDLRVQRCVPYEIFDDEKFP